MRFIPSDTVDPANLNRTFQRPSSPHEERSFFIVRLLTERAYFRFGKLLCRPGCVFTLGVVMQDQHRQPCTIAGPYVSQHFLVAVRISKMPREAAARPHQSGSSWRKANVRHTAFSPCQRCEASELKEHIFLSHVPKSSRRGSLRACRACCRHERRESSGLVDFAAFSALARVRVSIGSFVGKTGAEPDFRPTLPHMAFQSPIRSNANAAR